MQKLKKLICMLLCVTFVLSCIPVVHADDGDRTYCPYGHTSHVGIDCDAEMITWSKWTETTSLPTSGSYYLADDVTISSACSPSDLNLDLSGRSITRTLTSSSTGSATFSPWYPAKASCLPMSQVRKTALSPSVLAQAKVLPTAHWVSWSRLARMPP